ncbi:MAG: hypothetical protein JXQ73_11560 [Phycisphaerae bacterium]|nr:hypothetical protein [Phycisphaerae bacterium]
MPCSADKDDFGGSLPTAVDTDLAAGASFLEIYQSDIATYPDAVAYARDLLTADEPAD